MKTFNCLIITAFLLISCTTRGSPTITVLPITATSSATDSVNSVEMQWLKSNVIPFSTTDPNSSFEDLMPLKEVVGNARIVALGEATHGTHEFFQMKHRILKFLVEEMGFTDFAIEASFPEANLVNEYIHTGNGDPAKLLKGLHFWTWDTQEVLDMIQWMRAYNEDSNHTQKISFFGFDMQFDGMARDNVAQYLQRVDPQTAKQITDHYYCYPQASLDCQSEYQAVYDWLSQHQADYTTKSSPKEFAEVLQNARIMVQYRDLISPVPGSSAHISIRDQYMAENVAWLLKHAGSNAKMVLWAHNAHVGMSGEQSPLSMGDHLRNQFGNQMVVFGFLFYQGSFNAIGGSNNLKIFQIGIPPTNSYESYFYSIGLPRFFLDLRSAKAGSPATNWLLTPHPILFIGANYEQNNPQLYFENLALAKIFDVAIYFQDTSPSILLTK